MHCMQRWRRVGWAGTAGIGFVLSGCQAYRPAPLDLAAHDKAWRLPDLDSTAWSVAAEAADLSSAVNFTRGLNRREAMAVALYGNPELRRLRLEAGVAAASAEHAGRWDDPELGFDLLNNLDADDDPWLYGVSLGFTVPLSGRLEAAVAQADAEVALRWAEVAERERGVLQEVGQVWSAWSAAVLQVEAISVSLEEARPWIASAEALVEAGEMSPADARLLRIGLVQRELEQARLEHTVDQERLALLALLGLRPDVGLALLPTLETEAASWSSPVQGDARRAVLLAQPEVRAAERAYEVAEAVLRREVRKQYPDLVIGPAYENEDGQSRVGLGLGLPIPVFNANRAGIAEAQARRETARVDAEGAYQRAASALASAEARWRSASAMARSVREILVPLAETQVREARELLRLGEADVLLLNEALNAVIDTRLALIDADADWAAATLDLHLLMNPGAMPDGMESLPDEPNETAGAKR